MNITRNSNFSAELDKVKAFYDGLNKIDSAYKGTIVPIQDKITGFSCSSWTDNVGDEMLTLIKGIKEGEIVTLHDNQTIGAFQQIVNTTVALKDALGNCVTCEAQIRNDESTMASEARKRKEGEGYSSLYYSAKSDKEATEKALDGHIATANSLIAKYPNIHFNGAGYQNGAGDSSGADSASDMADILARASSGSPADWDVPTVWTTTNDKTTCYSREVDGYTVFFSVTREGKVLHYDVNINGTVHFYDANGKEISVEQRQAIRDSYNNS